VGNGEYRGSVKIPKRNQRLHAIGGSKGNGLKSTNAFLVGADKGLPNIEFCIRLADFYGVSLDELVGRDCGRIDK